MAIEGVDYSFARPSVSGLRAAGKTFACRYLNYRPPGSPPWGKVLDPLEASRLRSAGIDIVSNWERYGDWQHDYSGGRSNGRAHANEASRQHLQCGGPGHAPIYFSTDYNPALSQYQTIGNYYRGIADVIGVARTGAYAGYPVLKWLFDQGLIAWGWQTYAWSNNRLDPRAQLFQYHNGVRVAGGDCDLDRAMKPNYGQWGMAVSTPTPIHPPAPTPIIVQPRPSTQEMEDSMGQFRKGFAFDENGHLLDKSLIEILPLDTGTGGPQVGYVSVACDQGSAKLRIAVRGEPGGNWAVPAPRVVDSSQGRQGIWATGKGTGGTVTLGRMKQSATDTDDSTPLAWTVRYV